QDPAPGAGGQRGRPRPDRQLEDQVQRRARTGRQAAGGGGLMNDGAARIAPVPRDAWTEEVLAVFEIVEGARGREQGSRSNVILPLANHPALASRFLAFSHYLQRQSTLPPRLRELVILRVAWRHRCEYERRHHLNLAGYFGITPDECAAV